VDIHDPFGGGNGGEDLAHDINAGCGMVWDRMPRPDNEAFAQEGAELVLYEWFAIGTSLVLTLQADYAANASFEKRVYVLGGDEPRGTSGVGAAKYSSRRDPPAAVGQRIRPRHKVAASIAAAWSIAIRRLKSWKNSALRKVFGEIAHDAENRAIDGLTSCQMPF
jgi:hypothetical protein